MISSYQFSQRFDAISVMAGATVALFALLRTLAIVLGLAVALAVALAGLFAVVVAFWLPIAQIVGCLAIIALFGWVTFPRARAVKA